MPSTTRTAASASRRAVTDVGADVHHLECPHCGKRYPAQPGPARDVSHACKSKGGRQVYYREVTRTEHEQRKSAR